MRSDIFENEFDAFQGELKSYLLRVSGNKQDAEDFAQDTFIKARANIDKFMGNSSLKTWVFSIATNLVRDHFRSKKRWATDCQDNARSDAYENPIMIERLQEVSEHSAAGKFEIKEHIDFCFTCMGKTLPVDQQLAVILKDVYNFKVSEIIQILNSSEGKVKHALADGRNTLIRIFENKCALVSKKGACHQCSEMNGILNPKQEDQAQLMLNKQAMEQPDATNQQLLYDLRIELIRTIDPLNAKGSDLHNYFLDLMPHYSKLEEKPAFVHRNPVTSI